MSGEILAADARPMAGLQAGMPFGDYLADPCPAPSLSAHVLHTLITRSPAHAHREHPRLGGQPDGGSSRADLGSAVHAYVLGGEERVIFIEAADWQTKAAREMRDGAREMGRVPVLERQRVPIARAAKSALDTLADAGLADLSLTEQTAIWQDGGTWCRARPDLIARDRRVIVDLKTTTNARPEAWAKTAIAPGGYHTQAAWYVRALEALEGATFDPIFCVVEIDPPYACSLVSLHPRFLELGGALCEKGLRLWRECLAADAWPAYPSGVYEAEMPPWLEYQAVAEGVSDR